MCVFLSIFFLWVPVASLLLVLWDAKARWLLSAVAPRLSGDASPRRTVPRQRHTLEGLLLCRSTISCVICILSTLSVMSRDPGMTLSGCDLHPGRVATVRPDSIVALASFVAA